MLAFAASQCTAQSTPARTLLALSKGDHILAIIDPGTLKVIAKVPVGSDPHEVVASADGKTAYVSIYGSGSLHDINVIVPNGGAKSFTYARYQTADGAAWVVLRGR